MAAGMVLSVAQTLFAALECAELRELGSTFLEYKSRFNDLQQTVGMIKNVLLDAESKHQELSNEGRDWVEKLKDAIYDADDLFDEIITKAQQQKLSKGKFSKKVRRFLSSHNSFLFGFNKSREIKKLREKLDSIADDRKKFGISNEFKPVKRREETCSYVYESDIIGREVEKEEIVKLLSDPNSCVSFVSIVGMGGLGKTALAQLIFNDKTIRDAFSEGLYWVCVSENFGLREIFCQILGKRNSESTLDVLMREVREKIEGKKYFLVLDDVWEESKEEWSNLKNFLILGGVGSKVLVTTRSKVVGTNIGKDATILELQGLSEIDSWTLFKKVAFEEAVEDTIDAELVEIGKDIIKKCAHVPLSIRVTASLLHGMDKSRWETFRDMNLAKPSFHGNEDPIMSTLMFSYYNLTTELKSCFSFCSLFPKDYKLTKELLISLWLAQGYLVPRQEGETKSMEEVGEDYFSILLQRCFFQDVRRDEFGEIEYFKMHDLMHDVALKVAGKESLMLTTSNKDDLDIKLRHLSVGRLSGELYSFEQTLRALLDLSMYPYPKVDLTTLVSNCRGLRVLHLEYCGRQSLPDNLGKLLHLRYLNLSYNYSLKKLPKSITELHNLQIMKLCSCQFLIELPKDIGKLINLRMLDIHECSNLEELPNDIGKLVNLTTLDIHECSKIEALPIDIGKLVNLRILYINKVLNEYRRYFSQGRCKINYMPAGMEKLKNLHTLTYFVVGGDSSMEIQKGELKDLKGLKLEGHLNIRVGRFSPNNTPSTTKDILKKACLKSLVIECNGETKNGILEFLGPFDQGEYHETILEGLCPNNDLSTLVMKGYQGIMFPKWGYGVLTFPARIVRIELSYCEGLKHLSSMSNLVCLKYLVLEKMPNLEYIESDAPCDVAKTFFSSLEEFTIKKAEKLKGWWRDIRRMENEVGDTTLVDAHDSCVEILPSFPCLRDLKIHDCRSLKYFPPCPHLKKLGLRQVNEALSMCMKRSTYYAGGPSTSSSSDLSATYPTFFLLEKLEIDNATVFNSLFKESFLGSVHIKISYIFSLKEIKEIREGFQRCAAFVRHLQILYCHYLKSLEEEDKDGMPWKFLTSLSSLELSYLSSLVKLPKGLQYLTSLQSLIISDLELEVEGLPWKSLHSLSSLELNHLPKLVNLPKDFLYLSSLQSLEINNCENLEGLGEIVGSLTSLQSLHILRCRKLKSLPEAMGHLTSLTKLQIDYASPELKERCQEPNGEDCPKIRHICKTTISESFFESFF